jgi:hypothetical protein
MTTKINGKKFIDLVINGYVKLKEDMENINSLNVFPIPDGDTGTNMKMTIEGGVHEIQDMNETSINVISKKLARAMLLSARGNSGVILSQFFKGLSVGLAPYEEIGVKEIAEGFEAGVKQSYAVVKVPTEGTILTVMREASSYCVDNLSHITSLEEYFQYFLKEGNASLQRTPSLLPCLREAGVIDSGGQGFLRIVEGMALALDGKILENKNTTPEGKTSNEIHFDADSELTFGYCTEFILQLQNSKCDVKNFDENIIVSFLESIGDSIVAFKEGDLIKIHVHTHTPGRALNFCQKYGEFVSLKIENMSAQHNALSDDHPGKIKTFTEHKKYAFVAVSSGEGISTEFKNLGVDIIVQGGQTMNPSTDDFVKAFDKLNADYIIVFPNNSNIIMAATQAGETYEKAIVKVIPSKSIGQCYSALTMMDLSSDDIDTICSIFTDEIKNVTSAEVTYSIRDSLVNGVSIQSGDYLTIIDHQIKADSPTKFEAFTKICENVEDMDNKYVMVIIYGEDVGEDDKHKIRKYMQETYPNCEIGEIEGKQKIYSFIVSVE